MLARLGFGTDLVKKAGGERKRAKCELLLAPQPIAYLFVQFCSVLECWQA